MAPELAGLLRGEQERAAGEFTMIIEPPIFHGHGLALVYRQN